MSGIAHPHPPVGFRIRSKLTLLIVVLLVAGATIAGVLLISGDSESSSRTASPVTQTSGPDESLRGQAAASSAGSSQINQSGGPDETQRGSSAASASRP